jgi:hypothetical protein
MKISKEKLFEIIDKCEIDARSLELGLDNENITSTINAAEYGHDEARAAIILELELYFMNVNNKG